MTRIYAAAVVLVVTALMNACSGSSDQTAEVGVTPPGSAPAFVAPKVGECRGPITREIVAADSDTRPTVPCDQAHGSETVFVGKVPDEVAMLPRDVAAAFSGESPEMFPIIDICRAEFDRYVGVSPVGTDAVRPNNLSVPFFIPSADDWAKGARWFRCDAVPRPFDGQAERSTTESMRGIGARNPLPTSWRSCYRSASAPPATKFEGYTSCDQPHAAEVLLRVLSADPKIDELGADLKAIEAYAVKTFPALCQARVAAHMGLSVAQLNQRNDVDVASGIESLARWPTEPKVRWVQCTARTRTTVGTLEGLGTKPLPPATAATTPTTATTPAPGQPPTSAPAPAPPSPPSPEALQEAQRRELCQRYGRSPQRPSYCP